MFDVLHRVDSFFRKKVIISSKIEFRFSGKPCADDGCDFGNSGPIGQQEEKDSAESDDDLLEQDEDDEAEGDKTGLHLEAVIDDSGVLPKVGDVYVSLSILRRKIRT